MTEGRSLQPITDDDLARLATLAAADEADLFARKPDGAGRYAGRLLARALGQGAALHRLNHTNGVKDFDVWSFYAALPKHPYPYRRIGVADFGPSKFGTCPSDESRFTGRRVDLIGRSIPAQPRDTPAAAIRLWLRGSTSSAAALRARAVILIDPPSLLGTVLWPDA